MKLENQEMLKIPIKDLAKKTICDGHLYILGREGRKFYVMKPGMYLDQNFLRKHATLNTVFEFSPTTSEDVIEFFSKLFRELKYLHFEKDLRVKCAEIIDQFQKAYSSGENLLSFVIACHREFCEVPADIQEKIHETDLHLFRKATYSAAVAIVIGMSNDYYHFQMLKDFYNLTMVLDVGLCDRDYSYFVAQACNQENRSPGAGKKWLVEQKASQAELNVFLAHPDKSYQFLKSMGNLLSFPELAEIILYQHELSSGLGFPRGISKGQISSWEAIVILADSLFEITDKYDFENSFLEYVINFKSEKLSQVPIKKVHKKFCNVVHYFRELSGAG